MDPIADRMTESHMNVREEPEGICIHDIFDARFGEVPPASRQHPAFPPRG